MVNNTSNIERFGGKEKPSQRGVFTMINKFIVFLEPCYGC